MKRLLAVVGTRPNFIKVTRLKQVARDRGGIEVRLLHTGQHADARMSAVFFEEFGLAPDERLEVPECSAAARMGRLMLALEPAMRAARPDAVLVVGDVDSTLAAAITANKLGLPLAHLESGLRSGDREMPEELNRILTDRITDLLLVTEPSGAENLIREGISEDRIHQVGNAMIDTLVAFDDRIQSSNVLERLGLGTGGHALITIHRPSNVDSTESLARVVDLIAAIAETCKAVFPIHPRTLRGLERIAGACRRRPPTVESLVLRSGPAPSGPSPSPRAPMNCSPSMPGPCAKRCPASGVVASSTAVCRTFGMATPLSA